MQRGRLLVGIFALLVVAAGYGVLSVSQVTAVENGIWLDSNKHESQLKLNLPSFAPVIEELGKAVVNISTEGTEQLAQGGRTPFSSPKQQGSPFDFFFQTPPQGKRSFKTHSLGSGFVIHPDGLIVTNNHVVDRATKIVVTFKDDKKKYSGKVIGKDKKTDLALIKVDTDRPLDAVVVGNSENLRPGDWVIAIGNPFRLGHTVTVGIVSATSRKVPGGGPYDDFIQTDASINPGNSGGPLFNAKGEVVGVNTAIYSPGAMGSTGFNIGIGFAIPIEMARNVVNQLHDRGKVVRGWLGVLIQPVSEDVAEAMKLDKASGALVADVLPDSPAATAGVKRGDVIVSFDNKEVEENDDLPLMVADTPIDKVVKLEVIRAGKRKKLNVKIKELEDSKILPPVENAEQEKLGLSVQDLTPDIAKSLGVNETQGVVVTNVTPGSVAESAGMRRGDVVLEVGSKKIASTGDFREATKDVEKGKPMLLLVRRGEEYHLLDFENRVGRLGEQVIIMPSLAVIRRFARRVRTVVFAASVVFLAACGIFSSPEPEQSEVESPWYNTTGLKAVFGDHEKADPLYVSDGSRIAELRDRGDYLVGNVAACGACHGAVAGDAAASLSGGRLMRDSFGSVRAANITPDEETGIGRWNVGSVIRALRASLDFDGKPLSLDMHRPYRWMSDEDAKAIAVYILTRDAVSNQVERRILGGFERNKWGFLPEHRDVDGYVPEYRDDKPVPYGTYLAHHVSQCSTCHTARGGIFSSATKFAGSDGEFSDIETPVGALVSLYEKLTRDEVEGAKQAMPFVSEEGKADLRSRLPEEEGESVESKPARDIALETGEFPIIGPDIRGNSETGLADWSDEEIVRYLSSGMTPDGNKRDGRFCPWPFYRGMKMVDKQALAAFLKTL